ncbi:MAG: hypothetical protein E7333_04820 [Clostridiales bacterium]|nr:hypothetical protein [Clostridiales bacterium]
MWGKAPQAGVQRALPFGGGVGGGAPRPGCRGSAPGGAELHINPPSLRPASPDGKTSAECPCGD